MDDVASMSYFIFLCGHHRRQQRGYYATNSWAPHHEHCVIRSFPLGWGGKKCFSSEDLLVSTTWWVYALTSSKTYQVCISIALVILRPNREGWSQHDNTLNGYLVYTTTDCWRIYTTYYYTHCYSLEVYYIPSKYCVILVHFTATSRAT